MGMIYTAGEVIEERNGLYSYEILLDGKHYCRGYRCGSKRDVQSHVRKIVKRLNTQYGGSSKRLWRQFSVAKPKTARA